MNYAKVIMPAEDYQQYQQVGEKWIVRFAKVENEDGTIECAETINDSKPSAETIAEWEAQVAADDAKYNERISQQAITDEVADLKKKLADTDYEAIKYAEGWISAEDYAPIKAQRQAWRDRINELEN